MPRANKRTKANKLNGAEAAHVIAARKKAKAAAVDEPSAAHLAAAMADAACACHRSPHAAARLLADLFPTSALSFLSATLPPLADPAMFPIASSCTGSEHRR